MHKLSDIHNLRNKVSTIKNYRSTRILVRITLIIFIGLLCNLTLFAQTKYKAKTNTPDSQSLLWMQLTLDVWKKVVTLHLERDPEPLPWIIFYDDKNAWHLKADQKIIPRHKTAGFKLRYNSKIYTLQEVDHSGHIWVPGRDPIKVSKHPTFGMPYAGGTKCVFILPIPSFFHNLAPVSEAPSLDVVFLGLSTHELTHTRQIPNMLPYLERVQKQYNLPGSLDDNFIQEKYSTDTIFTAIHKKEQQHLWNAMLTSNRDTCLNELGIALKLVKERKLRYFSGVMSGYSLAEDSFLNLEGLAMWTQLKTTIEYLPGNKDWKSALFWLVPRSDSWSQEEGLALYLLIDRLIPNWKPQFFKPNAPSPFEVLSTALEKHIN